MKDVEKMPTRLLLLPLPLEGASIEVVLKDIWVDKVLNFSKGFIELLEDNTHLLRAELYCKCVKGRFLTNIFGVVTSFIPLPHELA